MQYQKHLIISLIVQDMRHEQLIGGLCKLGFESGVHGLDICRVVAGLMGIPETDMSCEWADIYMEYMGYAERYEITANGKNLAPLAEACYALLYAAK